LEDEFAHVLVYAQLCAQYLPAIIDGFLGQVPERGQNAFLVIQNARFGVLANLQFSPYFAKYFRSSDPRASNNRRLPGALADRLLLVAPVYDQVFMEPMKDPEGDIIDFREPTANVLIFMGTICMMYIKNDINTVVPRATRNKLSEFLDKWCTREPDGKLADACRLVLMLFNVDDRESKWAHFGSEKERARKHRKFLGGWDKCGLPTCDKRDGLKTCAKSVSPLKPLQKSLTVDFSQGAKLSDM